MPWMRELQSANWSQAGWVVLGAYLLGCFTTGYYLVRCLSGRDVRDLGSGNVGAKNVGRVLGWTGFTITILGDFAKGVLAVWAAQHFSKEELFMALAGLAVVVGHMWPAQLGFRGGKGMATSVGAVIVYDYHLVIVFMVIFFTGFAIVRRTVLPGLFAFACLPLACMYPSLNPVRAVGLSVMTVLILVAHRKNIITEFSLLFERRNVQPKPNQREI